MLQLNIHRIYKNNTVKYINTTKRKKLLFQDFIRLHFLTNCSQKGKQYQLFKDCFLLIQK